MAIEYRIDTDSNYVWTTITGVLTDEQLMEHKSRLLEDPGFNVGMRELSDLRAMEELAVTPEGIGGFVGFDEAHADCLEGHRLALLVPSDYAFGMARMYEMLRGEDGDSVMVFRDESEAVAWLENGTS